MQYLDDIVWQKISPTTSKRSISYTNIVYYDSSKFDW